MGQRNEVAVLTEAVDHREDHRFATNTGQRFNEVETDVGPDCGQNWQRHEKARRVFRLVALARRAGADIVLNHRAQVGRVEITA